MEWYLTQFQTYRKFIGLIKNIGPRLTRRISKHSENFEREKSQVFGGKFNVKIAETKDDYDMRATVDLYG